MLSVSFALNPRIRNKPPVWQSEFSDSWITTTNGELEDLKAAILNGTAFVAAAMQDSHRSSAAFLHADLVCVDIDGSMDIDTALSHPLVQQAALMYTTASHREEAGAHRFRVIFRLPQRVDDADLYKAVTTLLIQALGSDKSCSDPCHLYYGNDKGRVPLWNPQAVLPAAILDDGRALIEEDRKRFDRAALECDETSIERAIWVLERVLEPTRDGERDLFIRITAAAAAGGDALFPAWSDWASRGHHGSGKNSHQCRERFFRGMKGTSLGTLFYLASEQQPDWRRDLPDELRKASTGMSPYPAGVAGYSHDEFLGDPNEEPEPEATASLFDSQRPWTIQPPDLHADDLSEADAAKEQQEAEQDESALFADEDPDPAKPVIRKRKGRQANKGEEDIIEVVKGRLQRLYPGLRLNIMSQQLEYGPAHAPQPVHDPSTAYVRVSRGSGQVFGKHLVYDLALVVGYENRYHPVTSYIERCAAVAEPAPYFKELASTLIGLEEENPITNPRLGNGRLLADVIMERFLVGAVARVFEPGCRHDWMPILIGPQNCGKSTFFEYLTPPDALNPGHYSWCSTIQQGIAYLKDRPHSLHAGWIVVLDEIERYFKRQHVEELKNLISVSTDRSARKYENERAFPRSFVLAGAANNADFLLDPTGNRRFLPISVQGVLRSGDDPRIKVIDLDRLKRDRDAIWSAAYQAYLDGTPHNWSSHEISMVGEYLDSFGTDCPLDSRVARLLETRNSGYWRGQPYVTLTDLCEWLEVPLHVYAQHQHLLSDSLKRLRYRSKQVRMRVGHFGSSRVRRVWMEENKLRAAEMAPWDPATDEQQRILVPVVMSQPPELEDIDDDDEREGVAFLA